MCTLIAAYGSEGCEGRCDAKCYEATTPICTCICGGMNHGKGRQKAIENTTVLAERWMAEWKTSHPDTERFEVPDVQLSLF
jgi:hypothetical protein